MFFGMKDTCILGHLICISQVTLVNVTVIDNAEMLFFFFKPKFNRLYAYSKALIQCHLIYIINNEQSKQNKHYLFPFHFFN